MHLWPPRAYTSKLAQPQAVSECEIKTCRLLGGREAVIERTNGLEQYIMRP